MGVFSQLDRLDGNEGYKRKAIPKHIKNIVWQKYNPNSLTGKCYACNRPITQGEFDVGHNKAVANGGNNNILNLRPICRSCNSAMRTMSIEKFKKKYFGTEAKVEKDNRKAPTKKKHISKLKGKVSKKVKNKKKRK